MADLLSESVAGVGAEPGQKGMMTPEEIIALEQQQQQQAAAPAPEQKPDAGAAEPKPGEKPPAGTTGKIELGEIVDTEELLKKVQAGTELNEEEKAQLAIIQKEMEGSGPEVIDPDKTFNIGGKVLTAAEIDERIRKDANFGQLDLSATTIAKLREWYVRSQNREVQQVRVQQQSQINAQERQALLQAKMLRQRDYDERKSRQERLRRETEELRARAAVELTEADIQDENGKLNPVNLVKLQQKMEATERLGRIAEEELENERAVKLAEKELALTEISTLQAIAPQYKLDTDIFTAWESLQRGTLDPQVKDKVIEINEIYMAAKAKGISIEDEYNYRAKRTGALAFPPVAQTSAESVSRLPALQSIPAKSAADLINAYRKKKAAALPSSTSSGGATHQTDTRTAGERLVEHDREVLGTGRDPALKEIGW